MLEIRLDKVPDIERDNATMVLKNILIPLSGSEPRVLLPAMSRHYQQIDKITSSIVICQQAHEQTSDIVFANEHGVIMLVLRF